MGAEDSESAAGSRQASDVVVPNVVTTTFLEIQKLQICEAFHGSLRVYMDSHPVRKPLFFYPVSDKNTRSIYQDRLWTNTRRVETQGRFW
jgi:hypothetical protein